VNFGGFGQGKNKAKTKPIKANSNPIKANLKPKQTQIKPNLKGSIQYPVTRS
jgi:hypothetical protein